MNKTTIEHFPNELLLDLFEYIDIRDLFDGFWNLNTRFNHLLRSSHKLALNLERNDQNSIDFFSNQITQLILNTWENVDLKQFPNVQSLIIHHMTYDQLQQLRSEVFPKLVYLSTSRLVEVTPMSQLAQRLFSNEFPNMRSVDLSLVEIPHLRTWYQSLTLRTVTVQSNNPTLVPFILTATPKLQYLKVHFLSSTIPIFYHSLEAIHHSLKHFVLLDPYHKLSFNHIHTLLSFIPNVSKIYLNFLCRIPFHRFLRSLVNRLRDLQHFDCNIDDVSTDKLTDLDTIRQIHPCFHKIHCTTREFNFRTFITQ
ncbi:unnamed protein product [Adineta ricciae]|uniref:F-box domain-containing protein n=1 Tax=Adineta ricciae TaxID=249248 RepID=A0A813P346_ADIRI|nr:unnamed protein product [Adineta ricciae]